jgi:acyl carrier protein
LSAFSSKEWGKNTLKRIAITPLYMNLQDFIENFADQFDDTDKAVFTGETKFKELDEWSSLTALSIIAMVDDEYDVIIKGNDIINSETIQDLFEAVEKLCK